MKLFSGARNETTGVDCTNDSAEWQPFLPYEDWSHNSARITIPSKNSEDGNIFVKETFLDRLGSTVVGLRELGKSSIWIDVPMGRASLMEDMEQLGFYFHHAHGKNAVLNLWLKESENMVPEFATHHVGVGALVINSRNEILCVRELRKNYMPWKIPGGLSELGEHINEAAEREVYEETGIRAKFCDIVSFRHTHGLANGRSDLYFVCRLAPVEEVDEHGNVIIPEPVPQEGEIEATAWIPYEEFRDMVDGKDGHPMISHILDLHDRGHTIEQRFVSSIVPGRKPSPIYSPRPLTDLEAN
jgi:ADP-ribose pyrophosphatase YjhB (NUDIX family)